MRSVTAADAQRALDQATDAVWNATLDALAQRRRDHYWYGGDDGPDDRDELLLADDIRDRVRASLGTALGPISG